MFSVCSVAHPYCLISTMTPVSALIVHTSNPVVVMDNPVFILEDLRDILDRSIGVSPKSVTVLST